MKITTTVEYIISTAINSLIYGIYSFNKPASDKQND